MRRAALLALALLVGAGTAACSVDNQVGADQVPAVVSGVVTTGARAPFMVALVPRALVDATGKDGTHVVRADGYGRYHLSLNTGEWVLQAHAADGTRPGPLLTVHLAPAQQATYQLHTG